MRNDGKNSRRGLEGDADRDGGPEVEHEDRKAVDRQGIEKGQHGLGQVVKRVFVRTFGWHLGEAIPWEIRSNDVVLIGQAGNEVAVLKR